MSEKSGSSELASRQCVSCKAGVPPLAGEDLHKLLLTFSTGILAVYFLALTTNIKPGLTDIQSIISILGVLFMGVAVASGMVSLHADTKRNYFRACWKMGSDHGNP